MEKSSKILEVRQLDAVDVLKDMARIHESRRGQISVGAICKISVGAKARYLSIRGLPDEMLQARNLATKNPDYILLDQITRDHLGLTIGEKFNFEIKTARWWGRVWWAYQASDPAASVAAFIATWSLFLAVLGILFAVWSIYLSWK